VSLEAGGAQNLDFFNVLQAFTLGVDRHKGQGGQFPAAICEVDSA